MNLFLHILIFLSFLCYVATSFHLPSTNNRRVCTRRARTRLHLLKDDFPSDLDPYATLRVDRGADFEAIKRSYRALSKKYHADSIYQRSVLPGSCSDVDDVRDEWEKIKISYELLTDRKRKLRWDRMNVANDPGAAAGRAVLGFVGGGLGLVGKGVFAGASMALEALSSEVDEAPPDPSASSPSPPSRGLPPFPRNITQRQKKAAAKKTTRSKR
mmetsp:Transcript_12800/g.26105  ORF Transcript_12800/g.26105 Transcript_12800/m.26105 type:complete len:214 (+) Transcript_12800:247-888(+)